MSVRYLHLPFAARTLDLAVALVTLRFWLQRRRERQQLLDLDERLLRDIGLSRAEAEREAAKPIWMA